MHYEVVGGLNYCWALGIASTLNGLVK